MTANHQVVANDSDRHADDPHETLFVTDKRSLSQYRLNRARPEDQDQQYAKPEVDEAIETVYFDAVVKLAGFCRAILMGDMADSFTAEPRRMHRQRGDGPVQWDLRPHSSFELFRRRRGAPVGARPARSVTGDRLLQVASSAAICIDAAAGQLRSYKGVAMPARRGHSSVGLRSDRRFKPASGTLTSSGGGL
jgi:hypothetical protein